jgi:hypothetical protein
LLAGPPMPSSLSSPSSSSLQAIASTALFDPHPAFHDVSNWDSSPSGGPQLHVTNEFTFDHGSLVPLEHPSVNSFTVPTPVTTAGGSYDRGLPPGIGRGTVDWWNSYARSLTRYSPPTLCWLYKSRLR